MPSPMQMRHNARRRRHVGNVKRIGALKRARARRKAKK
jgi:hypothetical protein